MARYVIAQGFTRDGNGAVIVSANIQIYVADSTTAPSAMYTAKTGGTAITTGQTTSSSTDGSFIIYVDDGDYALNSEFDMVVSKTGYTTQYLYDLRG